MKTKKQKTIWWFNKQAKRKKYHERERFIPSFYYRHWYYERERFIPSFYYRHWYWYDRFQKQKERNKRGEFIFKVEADFKRKTLCVGFRGVGGKERFVTERFS